MMGCGCLRHGVLVGVQVGVQVGVVLSGEERVCLWDESPCLPSLLLLAEVFSLLASETVGVVMG